MPNYTIKHMRHNAKIEWIKYLKKKKLYELIWNDMSSLKLSKVKIYEIILSI